MPHDRLPNLLGALSLAVGDILSRTGERVTGLTGEAPAAVLTIGSRPGRSIEHLRRTVGLSHSGAVRLVDRLEERGWVRRVSPDAGREVHLELTRAGRGVFRHLLDARRAAMEELLRPVPEDVRAALEGSLAAVLETVPSRREDAWRICRLCEHDVCRGAGCPVGSAVDAVHPASPGEPVP